MINITFFFVLDITILPVIIYTISSYSSIKFLFFFTCPLFLTNFKSLTFTFSYKFNFDELRYEPKDTWPVVASPIRAVPYQGGWQRLLIIGLYLTSLRTYFKLLTLAFCTSFCSSFLKFLWQVLINRLTLLLRSPIEGHMYSSVVDVGVGGAILKALSSVAKGVGGSDDTSSEFNEYINTYSVGGPHLARKLKAGSLLIWLYDSKPCLYVPTKSERSASRSHQGAGVKSQIGVLIGNALKRKGIKTCILNVSMSAFLAHFFQKSGSSISISCRIPLDAKLAFEKVDPFSLSKIILRIPITIINNNSVSSSQINTQTSSFISDFKAPNSCKKSSQLENCVGSRKLSKENSSLTLRCASSITHNRQLMSRSSIQSDIIVSKVQRFFYRLSIILLLFSIHSEVSSFFSDSSFSAFTEVSDFSSELTIDISSGWSSTIFSDFSSSFSSGFFSFEFSSISFLISLSLSLGELLSSLFKLVASLILTLSSPSGDGGGVTLGSSFSDSFVTNGLAFGEVVGETSAVNVGGGGSCSLPDQQSLSRDCGSFNSAGDSDLDRCETIEIQVVEIGLFVPLKEIQHEIVILIQLETEALLVVVVFVVVVIPLAGVVVVVNFAVVVVNFAVVVAVVQETFVAALAAVVTVEVEVVEAHVVVDILRIVYDDDPICSIELGFWFVGCSCCCCCAGGMFVCGSKVGGISAECETGMCCGSKMKNPDFGLQMAWLNKLASPFVQVVEEYSVEHMEMGLK
ncbi:hypothetical protein AGLY_006748 [Aphis glycines]|uniref:Uncharacterized protein n=1 Tax=Aphis glycines TaxID=307491 RepID=A0A6G0TSG4_APHGL|nr:hypothetical protein AGLY_006748 [Aphis glycines]